jgi:predicted DNA-binding transcriptional regulator AlpA
VHITDVVGAMREDGFSRVQIFSWQDLGHAPPPAELFDRALTWIESSTRGP